MRWSEIFSNKKFTRALVLSLVCLVAMAIGSSYFFDFVQRREGIVLTDPLLDILPARDLSNVIFFILYLLIVVTVFFLWREPARLIFGLQTYALMMLIRFVTIFLIALEPPTNLVALRDPLATLFFYGQGVVTKDLFFSGHAATLFLLVFLVQNRILKYALLIGSIVLSVLLLIQHIHYTYDVLAAPVFAFAAYKMSGAILKVPASGVALKD